MTLSQIYLRVIPKEDQETVLRILRKYGTTGLEVVKNNSLEMLKLLRESENQHGQEE